MLSFCHVAVTCSNAGIKAVTVDQLSKTASTTQNAVAFRHQRSHNPQIHRESGMILSEHWSTYICEPCFISVLVAV